MATFERIAELSVDPATGLVHEHGWQSWSPSSTYRIGERPHRPGSGRNRVMTVQVESPAPADVFQGEGLLAVQPHPGAPVRLFAATDGTRSIPSIRAEASDGRVTIWANGDVEATTDRGPGGIDGTLARWADGFGARMGVTDIVRAPTGWCSWYHYFTAVTEADMDENLEVMGRLDLPIEVVQLDDGYQSELGDWLTLSNRFASVRDLVARIRSAGRRAGIWVAPFLVGARSQVAAKHPDWLVGGPEGPTDAGYNWNQDLYALDTTHPGARAYLAEVFGTFRAWGIDYFKIDFVYAGAMPGRRHEDVSPVAAYRSGVQLIRDSIGDSYLLGCGAPILPSVGLVDAMRISPDCAPYFEPKDGDMTQPSNRAAILTGVGRAFQQGRFWVNDPDCLIVRPAVERREEWAAHVERYGGLRASSDRLLDLDDWGLETTRRLLEVSPTEPFIASGASEPASP